MKFSMRDKLEMVLFVVLTILFIWLVATRVTTIHDNIQEQERQEQIWREQQERNR